METDFPTASHGTSQAPSAAVKSLAARHPQKFGHSQFFQQFRTQD
jgi:hypothetical protein